MSSLFHFAHGPFTPYAPAPDHVPPESSLALSGIISATENAPSEVSGRLENAEGPGWQLYSNRAELKIITSKVAMHLTESQREDIFRQIDDLLDRDSWTDDDSLISSSSYRTFLRFMIYCQQVRRPALTVSHLGNISASWDNGTGRMTIEFRSNDTVRISLYRKDSGETMAYLGPLVRLDSVIEPFDAMRWYRG